MPDQLSIIGFDDIDEARHSLIALSTIRNDVAYLARLAVERLLSLIDNQGALPPPKFDFLRGDLVVRESTATKSKSI